MLLSSEQRGFELDIDRDGVRDANKCFSRFSKIKKTKRNPRDVPRAMGKIFKEAGKVKLVLSANKEYTAQIENVMDDEDLRIPFSREEILQANDQFFDRVTGTYDNSQSVDLSKDHSC